MVRARDFASLSGLGEILDQEYQVEDFRALAAERQLSCFFKKNEALANDDACKLKAQETFLRGEKRCRITNKRLDYFYSHRDRLDPQLSKWLARMEYDIHRLLGDEEVDPNHIVEGLRLTNGATEDRSRKRAYPFLKVTGRIRAPARALPHVMNYLAGCGVDVSSCRLEPVEHNVVTTVPKNWKTHRTIAKEPTHSLPYQLALDADIKRRLRRWGIDLSTQRRNQEMAKQGSLDGSLATIDLEMASDTLSLNAVAWMLPVKWFDLLRSFRSSFYESEWGVGEYAKFSSMGNGYTFALETLIFTAACRAIGAKDFTVYGDDIILETELAGDLIRLLGFLGFKTNEAKTFRNPACLFRESCGHDYHQGVLVTPFYLRELPKLTDRAGVSHVINGLAAVTGPGPAWEYLAGMVKKLQLRLVPLTEDTRSGVFIDPHSAWIAKKLFVDKRKPTVEAPERVTACGKTLRRATYQSTRGHVCFKGYSLRQDTRKVAGPRSLFLWHMEAHRKGEEAGQDATLPIKARASERLLMARMTGNLPETSAFYSHTAGIQKSAVSVRARYVHEDYVMYQPVRYPTPLYLYLWAEVLLTP